MSQIFDALQRSEAERTGASGPASTRATELLQRTEEHASAETATAVLPRAEQESGPLRGGLGDLFPELSSVKAGDAFASAKVMPVKENPQDPSTFPTLQISLEKNSRLVALPESDSAGRESFQLLSVRLRTMRRKLALKKLLITSTVPQEGKSIVTANLACSLALSTSQRVLLLEGDVRRPTQSSIFGIGVKQGICEWLRGEASLSECIYRLEGVDVWILPAGNVSNAALELMQSGKLAPLMEQLSSWFDWIVIDSPPVLPLADTSVWTNLADGILLVTRQGVTQKKQLQKGLDAISSPKLLGAILNSSKNVDRSDYYYRPANRLPNDVSS